MVPIALWMDLFHSHPLWKSLLHNPVFYHVDPPHETISKQQCRTHMEMVHNEANKLMWNSKRIHKSRNQQIANANLHMLTLASECGHHTLSHPYNLACNCRLAQR